MFFRDVIGQERFKQQLTANVAQGRISHSQLFLGSEDSGALALALAFARYIQCTRRGQHDACGTCPSCQKFDKMAHPDLHFFFPSAPNQEHKDKVSSKLFLNLWRERLLASPYFKYMDWLEKLGIEKKQAIINAEDCNDIIRALGLKAYESPYKVVLIYQADKIYYSAAPKLLKVLEEPPENTLFLMVSDNKEAILNTILSRTQLLKLPLPEEDAIRQTLEERYGLDPERARQIAFITGGSVTEALRLAHHGDEELADFESFREWMRYCFKNNVAEILKWSENIAQAGREKQKSFFRYGLKIFRTCLLKNYGAEELIRLDGEEKKFIERFSPYVNHRNALKLTDSFNTAIHHLERNANPRILFTELSFQLVRLLQIKPQ